MTTALITHPACFGHVTPPGHPERVARLEAVLRVLDDPQFGPLVWHEAPVAPDTALRRCHPQAYLDRIAAAVPTTGHVALDSDTHVMAGSVAAARRAAGAVLMAVDLVIDGSVDNAFCAVRPPGHHCETERAMGFCLYGSVAVAAKHALEHHVLDRVTVIDFDVYHGNGTQYLLWNEPRAPFISLHQSPLYPGSGTPDERGASGQITNIPLPPGTDGTGFREAFTARALPALRAARPELILVSAGFDAHAADPLAQMSLGADDFGWATDRICEVARDFCGGKLVSSLEGGYDLAALAESTAAHVRSLMSASGTLGQSEGGSQ